MYINLKVHRHGFHKTNALDYLEKGAQVCTTYEQGCVFIGILYSYTHCAVVHMEISMLVSL